jgi:hypothetical protein
MIAECLIDFVKMKNVVSLPEMHTVDLEIGKSSDTGVAKLLSAWLIVEKHILDGLPQLAVLRGCID